MTTCLGVGPATLELLEGDITRVAADAIVNAANGGLRGGGGVDGAIHRAGGPAILEACRALGGCATGDAVVTTAGALPARWVVHAVGPVWRGGRFGEPEQLASAYRRALEVADGLGAASVAFPSLSTGAYGYPIEAAAPLALRTVAAALAAPPRHVRRVVFVLFGREAFAAYSRALEHVGLARDPESAP